MDMNTATIADDRRYIKRLRERMRRRGYLLMEVYKPQPGLPGAWGWWWINAVTRRKEFGPYKSIPEAFVAAESLSASHPR